MKTYIVGNNTDLRDAPLKFRSIDRAIRAYKKLRPTRGAGNRYAAFIREQGSDDDSLQREIDMGLI